MHLLDERSRRRRTAARGRLTRSDLREFRHALDAAMRRAIVTPILVLGCVLALAAMTAAGVPMHWPSASQLVDWGANDGARVILRHEYWRLIASVFVHGGVIHLAANMMSLLMIGPLVERIYGHLAFAAIYLAAGAGGAIASMAVPPVRVSVGASGAICGVLGALLAFLVVHRRQIPSSVLRQFRTDILGLVACMAIVGAVVPNIDQAAHVGGLAAGFVGGLLLSRPWPVVRGSSRRVAVRQVAMTGVIVVLLAGSAVAAARRGVAMIPPDHRLDDLAEQLAPAIAEFFAIRREMSRSSGRFEQVDDPARRQACLTTIGELSARATANAARIRRVTTSDGELRAMCDSLSCAQARQIDGLAVLDLFIETRNPAALAEAREAMAAALKSVKDCERHRLEYMAHNGLIPELPRSPP